MAEAQGPGPTLLTAAVELRVLRSDLVIIGQVRATSVINFTPSAGQQSDAAGVVTKVPKAVGAKVSAGDVIAEIDGRPVIALPGTTPAYRNLLPGADGRDVQQLQRALRAVGEDVGDEAKVYGPRTKRAVVGLYDKLGYEPTSVGDKGELRALRLALRTAERTRQDAAATLADLPATSPERRSAEVATSRAADDLADARAELARRDAAGVSHDELRGLRRALQDAERSDEDAAAALAAVPARSPERRTAQQAVDRAAEDVATAREDLADAEKAAGPTVPSSEVVFLPYVPARITAIAGGVGSRISAKPLVTVAGGKLVVDAEVAEDQLDKLSRGVKAEVTGDAGKSVSGKVTNIGVAQVSKTGQRVAVVRVTTDVALPASSLGTVVRVAVKVDAAATETLVVPLAAVFSDASAKSYVSVVRSGVKTSVNVAVDEVVDGYASITPVGGGEGSDVRAGDEVVVGTVAQGANAER